jgi:hypothetical protein
MKILNIVIGIIVIVALVVATPVIVIWSLNTVFTGLAIPYTWQTWLAVFALTAVLRTLFTINIR